MYCGRHTIGYQAANLDSVETNYNIGETNIRDRDKSECKYQLVQDKSETNKKTSRVQDRTRVLQEAFEWKREKYEGLVSDCHDWKARCLPVEGAEALQDSPSLGLTLHTASQARGG
ncbi:hypothetical protein N1851_012930 [Merluccius polli]|uniref:Uncharacterized protein n=1 Tax=Merluccius polli TaxID=89951 RepID=A0AA47MW22_MERPO|nr:hypothetical protein N1851_012930 [Merluccius polli]